MNNRSRFSSLLLPTVCGLAALSWCAQGCSDSDDDDDGGAVAGSSGTPTAGNGGKPNVSFGGASGSGASTHSGSAGVMGQAGGLCGGNTVAAEPIQVNALFVIDRSESMKVIPDGFTEPKWESMVTALKASLEGVRAQMAVGLQFFPDPTDAAADALCGMPSGSEVTIPIGAGDVTVPMIQAKLDESRPAGSTPTADALALALEYFTNGDGAELEGKKYVLLALDGGPNCNEAVTCGEDTPQDRALCTQTYDKPMSCGGDAPFNCCSGQPKGCLDGDRVLNEVERLRDAGIVTIVVGIPGSEPYADVLDALAEKGGAPASPASPRYFKVEDPEALTQTLSALSFDLIRSCELQLGSAPPDTDKVNVYLDDSVVPQLGDDGWELDTSSPPGTIRLKGETCAHVETNGARTIRVEFGCPTVYRPR